jgi:hypothetical protein
VIEALLALADHHLNPVDSRVAKRGQGMREEGADRPRRRYCFGNSPPARAAASCRDHQGHRLSPRFHCGGSYPSPTLPASAFDPISAVPCAA